MGKLVGLDRVQIAALGEAGAVREAVVEAVATSLVQDPVEIASVQNAVTRSLILLDSVAWTEFARNAGRAWCVSDP